MDNAFLTIDHINEGFEILDKITKLRDELEKFKENSDREGFKDTQDKIVHLSNQYFSLIPFKDAL